MRMNAVDEERDGRKAQSSEQKESETNGEGRGRGCLVFQPTMIYKMKEKENQKKTCLDMIFSSNFNSDSLYKAVSLQGCQSCCRLVL